VVFEGSQSEDRVFLRWKKTSGVESRAAIEDPTSGGYRGKALSVFRVVVR